MEMTELIKHPERLDRDTLYELRSMLALHPYFQTARILMLHNLFLLHDASFDEELRKAALYITDRKVIFQMIEAGHYILGNDEAKTTQKGIENVDNSNRTVALIDNFLDSIPADDEEQLPEGQPKRKPTPADAAIDYVAYLLATENTLETEQTPQMKGQDLIDTFLQQEQGRIQLSQFADEETTAGSQEEPHDEEESQEEEYFTETLARIYIKQGRYQKALDIIGRLNQQFPHKNAYFADQMRFLEKLIINNNKIKN
jgi:hypothetical protein